MILLNQGRFLDHYLAFRLARTNLVIVQYPVLARPAGFILTSSIYR